MGTAKQESGENARVRTFLHILLLRHARRQVAILVKQTDPDTGEPLIYYYINAKGDVSQTMPKEGVSYVTQV